VKKRKCNEVNTQEFLNLLKQVTWQDVFSELDINAKFTAFMDVVGASKVVLSGCENCRNLDLSSNTVGITVAKEMFSVSY